LKIADLPLLNAILNSASAVLLFLGWWFISRERKIQHAICMIAALVTSTAFLTSYLIYHYNVGSVKFTEQGWIRPVYFTILLTHTVLAVVNLPLIIGTVIAAATRNFERHRKWARWTLPIWLYVSITGVVIYLMLYQWFPPEQLHR